MLLKELAMFDFLYNFIILGALFLIYSFIGWMIEVIYTLIEKKKFVNRGFLIGPLVPIWGTGAVLITIILRPDDSLFNLVISSAFIGTFLEYVVNYLMEKMFKVRWWDYSSLPFNINGRVWLGSSCFFGIGGLLIVKIMNPLFFRFFSIINDFVFSIIIMVLLLFVLTDFCISFNIINKLKISVDSVRKDYTEEISKKVKAILMNKSMWFKRLLNAFPNVKFSFKAKK